MILLPQTRCHPLFRSQQDVVHVALGCRRGSGCAMFNQSSPVIGPDRCKAALLSEHVASWWRGGGCGIGRKRATSKNIALHVLSFPHAVTSRSCCWNVKTGCQAATNRKSKSLKWVSLFLKRGWLFARGHAAQALDVILISFNERHPPNHHHHHSPTGDNYKKLKLECSLLATYLPAVEVKFQCSHQTCHCHCQAHAGGPHLPCTFCPHLFFTPHGACT